MPKENRFTKIVIKGTKMYLRVLDSVKKEQKPRLPYMIRKVR